MLLNNLKMFAAVIFVLAAMNVRTASLLHRLQAAYQDQRAKPEQEEPGQWGEGDSPLRAVWKERLIVRPKVPQQIFCVAVSPDAQTVASGEANGVRLLNAESGRELGTLRLEQAQYQPAMSLAFSPGGKLLAAGYAGGALVLWDVDSASVKTHLKGHTGGVVSIAFSYDGKTLASAPESPEAIRFWNVETGRETSRWEIDAKKGIWTLLAFSPDDCRLASTEGRDVQVREVATGKTILTLKGHTDQVVAVAYSRDGKLIASGGADYTLRIWDAETGKVRRGIVCPTAGGGSLAFSPDGKMLASGGGLRNRDAWLNDPTGHTLLDGWVTLAGHTSQVRALAFAPDGSFLATVGDDALRLWSPAKK